MNRVGRGTGRMAVAGGLAAVVLGLSAAPSWAGNGSGGGLGQAKKDLLVRADFPSGWSGQGGVTKGSSSSAFPGEDQLAACLGVSKALLSLNPPSLNSPNFQNKDGSDGVQDNVSVFGSPKVGASEYAAISDPRVPSCMTSDLQGPGRQQLTQAIGSGATVGTITVTPAAQAMLVPHSSGFTISFPVVTQGVTVPSAVTVVSMVRGRYASQLTLTAAGLPFSATLAHHLVAAAYART